MGPTCDKNALFLDCTIAALPVKKSETSDSPRKINTGLSLVESFFTGERDRSDYLTL